MNVILDNNALVYLLLEDPPAAVRARLRGLLEDVQASRGLVLIPTPVLTEYLSVASEAAYREKFLAGFRNSRWVKVANYDEVAAVEAAELHRKATAARDKRHPLDPRTPWQSVKVDRQLVALARVHRARIITGDDGVLRMAEWAGVQALRVEDLPIPDSERQMEFPDLKAVAATLRAVPGTAPSLSPSAQPSLGKPRP